jgi:predicted lipoprotein with Yx(FWY)xxD motif
MKLLGHKESRARRAAASVRRRMTLLVAAAAPVAIALLAAGCGNSASGSPYASQGYGAAPMASAASNGSAGAARVGVGKSSLGRIVVDGKGRTLYLFEKDKTRRSACYGQCAKYWPPLLTHGKPVAKAGAKQSLLGMTRRADGSRQVTYASHPLYRFVEDTKQGQTKGEASQLFGAGWDAVSPAGKKIEVDDD